MGTGFAKKKKQAKMLQEQFAKAQEQMKNKKVTGTSGGDLVSVTITGEYEVESVKLKKECVDPEDVEGLEDLLKVAFADALKKLQEDGSDPHGLPNLASFGF